MFDFLFPSTNICDERQLHRPLFFFPCNIFLPRTIRCLHKRTTHTLANGFVKAEALEFPTTTIF